MPPPCQPGDGPSKLLAVEGGALVPVSALKIKIAQPFGFHQLGS